MAKIEIPSDISKGEIFDFLVANKDLHITEKKSALKKADAFQFIQPVSANKAARMDLSSASKLEVNSVINTTKVMDSHDDVHINGIWSKSLKENKDLILLQEHIMKFDHIISDQVKATAEIKTWKELGFRRFKGETQALMFKSILEKEINEFMFKKYATGQVKNHSVGMNYVKLFLAINSDSEEHKEQKEVWDKYSPEIVNIKSALDQGYFWAVTEAKAIEGSAVVKGSNPLTPTESTEAKEVEPPNGTHKTEPHTSTQKNTRRRYY